MRIAYGYRVKESNDPFLTDVEVAVEQFSLSTAPGGFLVNLVPSRQYSFLGVFSLIIVWNSTTYTSLVPGSRFQAHCCPLGRVSR